MLGEFIYNDRAHAGKVLAEYIMNQVLHSPFILALPRGGLPVADEVAHLIKAPMDVLVVRKIGAPSNPEYGIGAMCEDLIPVMSAESFFPTNHMEEDVKATIQKEKKELVRRIQLFRHGRALPDLKSRSVIVVDDGIATGVTAASAGKYLKSIGAREVILAVPVGPRHLSDLVRKNFNEIICPYTPSGFSGVGNWYRDFRQVSDEEVIAVLNKYYPHRPGELYEASK